MGIVLETMISSGSNIDDQECVKWDGVLIEVAAALLK